MILLEDVALYSNRRLLTFVIVFGDFLEFGARVLVGRVGKPEEVADLAVAVLRNGYVTSHVFSVDGGMHPG